MHQEPHFFYRQAWLMRDVTQPSKSASASTLLDIMELSRKNNGVEPYHHQIRTGRCSAE